MTIKDMAKPTVQTLLTSSFLQSSSDKTQRIQEKLAVEQLQRFNVPGRSDTHDLHDLMYPFSVSDLTTRDYTKSFRVFFLVIKAYQTFLEKVNRKLKLLEINPMKYESLIIEMTSEMDGGMD